MTTLLDQLQQLPDHWGFVAVDDKKRPYQPAWQKNPLTKSQVAAELNSGRAHAVGVIAGPQSQGLLFVDHDGPGASEVLDKIDAPLSSLPKSWAVTSGRDARLQIIYQVPKPFWDQIKTTKIKSSIENEQLELRWSGCQSVVIGAHPTTGAYRWIPNRDPSSLPIAEAPTELLQQMLKQPDPMPLLRLPDPFQDAQRARDYLSRISTSYADNYDDWVRVGMALHATDDSLLQDWVGWSATSGKFEAGICEAKWKSFSPSGGVGLGTLHHLATPAPITLGKQQPTQSPKPADNGRQPKFEAHDLLRLLRLEHGHTLRWNIFTQQIEQLEGDPLMWKPIDKIDLYYLRLAEQGVKVSKELASDCLIKVATENPHDPVKQWLDSVASQVPPANIDHLATKYLRTADKPGTLYDAMVRATLIAAVRRIYHPGCKHDSACVLMGAQGIGKSWFWRVLGGLWFSDALRDITSKDDLMILHRSWIMEWAELDHVTGRRHAGQVKSFLSQQVDTFRMPYARTTEDFPRRSIIVGSTNREAGFLADDTGNRRFWIIPVAVDGPMIDITTLTAERDAIWAAAVLAVRNGATNHLSQQQAATIDRENEHYLIESPWIEPIASWLQQPRNQERTITSQVLLSEAICKPIERQTRSDQMQVASILRDMGYERHRKQLDGALKWVYTKAR